MGKIKDAIIDQMNEQAQSGPLQWIADSTAAQPIGVITTPIPDGLAGLSKEPVIYVSGKQVDFGGVEWDFEKRTATSVCADILIGKIQTLIIEKTWIENE